MTKSELIESLARRSGLPAESARRAVEALFGAGDEAGLIAGALRAGDRVHLAGFGTFEARQRKERLGRNPQTRAPMVIPGGVAAAFRAGSSLKASLRVPS